MERRLPDASKSAPLPVDFLRMVTDVFTSNFGEGLKALSKQAETPMLFQAHGAVYGNEIILCLTLRAKDHTKSTSVYASADFDPKASSPTAQDLINYCVDAVGAIYSQFLIAPTKDTLEQLSGQSLWNMENIPFHWSPVEIDKRVVFLKVDRTNPELDQLADQWLEKNDPKHKERLEEEFKETEKLFVTGKKAKKDKLH